MTKPKYNGPLVAVCAVMSAVLFPAILLSPNLLTTWTWVGVLSWVWLGMLASHVLGLLSVVLAFRPAVWLVRNIRLERMYRLELFLWFYVLYTATLGMSVLYDTGWAITFMVDAPAADELLLQ